MTDSNPNEKKGHVTTLVIKPWNQPLVTYAMEQWEKCGISPVDFFNVCLQLGAKVHEVSGANLKHLIIRGGGLIPNEMWRRGYKYTVHVRLTDKTLADIKYDPTKKLRQKDINQWLMLGAKVMLLGGTSKSVILRFQGRTTPQRLDWT